MKYFILLISITLGSIAQYLLKAGMIYIGIKNISLLEIIQKGITNLTLWLGIFCYAASLLLWLQVLSQFELSKAYPLISLGYILTLIWGYLFLNESLSIYKIFGTILIIIGVFFIIKG